MRLIDADALFVEFENVGWYNNADRDEVAERLVLQAPTIDAIEVGKWVLKTEDSSYWYVCSQCGERPMCNRFSYMEECSDYCPNCGARMYTRGEDE